MRSLLALALAALSVSLALAQSPSPAAPQATAPTFVHDVAPILHARCISCHREGEMAPMSLVTYEETRPWARSIRHQVAQRLMPPWFANPAIGHFANDLSLSEREIDVLTRWVNSGAPRGDGPEPTPPPAKAGWHIGTPDLVLKLQQPFQIPAQGIVEYQLFHLPTGLQKDTWVTGVEIRPTNPRSVHHLRVFASTPGTDASSAAVSPAMCPRKLCGDVERSGDGLGENIASIAVGTQPDLFPAGTAKLLKAGSVISLNVHYVTTGISVADQMEIGFVFASAPPTIELEDVSLAQPDFTVPPGASDHQVTGAIEFEEDVLLWMIGPHAHLRGKSWKFEVLHPDGREQTVLDVPRFDFNWQMNYELKTPLPLKAGARLRATAVYDNSAANKGNPDPSATVRWGDLTTDEMMFATITYSIGHPPRLPGQ